MTDLIYLDHAATTPLRPDVLAAMEPFLRDNFANPSAVYRSGQVARAAVDRARDTVAQCLGVEAAEIVFTSGGSESNNTAIKGCALARQGQGRHVVTTAIEHHAVLHPFEELREYFGFEVSVVPVDAHGIVDVAELARALRPDTTMISMMWANNEIGTIQPVDEVGALARRHGITFHVDAVQAAAHLPLDLTQMPVDLLSLSAHKFYGPKGVGVLVLRRGTPWRPLLTGGGQERNRRAGTENVAGIVGLATALELAMRERVETAARLTELRDMLFAEIERRIPDSLINGHRVHRLPNNVNVSFPGVHGESLLVGLDLAGVMASSGSACASGTLEPSHVLAALGQSRRLTAASLRLTLGRNTTRAEIERASILVGDLVTRLRSVAPVRA